MGPGLPRHAGQQQSPDPGSVQCGPAACCAVTRCRDDATRQTLVRRSGRCGLSTCLRMKRMEQRAARRGTSRQMPVWSLKSRYACALQCAERRREEQASERRERRAGNLSEKTQCTRKRRSALSRLSERIALSRPLHHPPPLCARARAGFGNSVATRFREVCVVSRVCALCVALRHLYAPQAAFVPRGGSDSTASPCQ